MGRFGAGLCGLVLGVATMSAGCGSDDEGTPSGGSGGTGQGAGIGTGGTGTSSGSGGAGATGDLPESDNGIASQFPGDVGIESHSDVVFADDFEGYADIAEVTSNWDPVHHIEHMRIAEEPDNVYRGNRSVELTVPQQDSALSDHLGKILTQERDILFLRFYSKFAPTFDIPAAVSTHNGAKISAHYEDDNGQATPGIPANGTNKFLVNYETDRWNGEGPQPGRLNVYIYHPEQRSDYGDHFYPTGLISPNTSLPSDFGPDFVARPDVVPELDRWYAYELMVKANTVGQRDGRIAFWLDGVLIADFLNMRLRDTAALTIDRFGIGLYMAANPAGETSKWYDNVVAATSYIGPLVD